MHAEHQISTCEDVFLKDLVEEHNRHGGKLLDLHEPVCLGYLFEKYVVFANFTTPFVLHLPELAAVGMLGFAR